jgi:hypothetical protein
MVPDFAKNKLLFLLLTTDLVFVLLHLAYTQTSLLSDSMFSLARDRGYAEFFQYMKELWILLLLRYLAVKRRSGLFGVFSLLFLYFLLDDALEFHENMGKFLADLLHLPAALGLRPMDWGELLVTASFAVLFASALWLVYLLSPFAVRPAGRSLMWLVVWLVGFGVLADMVEILLTETAVAPLLVILEEAGEMVAMSVGAWYVFLLDPYQEELPAFSDLVAIRRLIRGKNFHNSRHISPE